MSSTDPRTCPHEHSQPVDVPSTITGDEVETVARICTACLEELPAAWGCTECEWVETREFCDLVPHLLLGWPCQEHA